MGTGNHETSGGSGLPYMESQLQLFIEASSKRMEEIQKQNVESNQKMDDLVFGIQRKEELTNASHSYPSLSQGRSMWTQDIRLSEGPFGQHRLR
ncbi:hypothetical protein A4A49_22183 [Nicotiana attenuata]|uniref:Uncharacterized protein n=1 Tax=Nicotiana attenuata TaxID=49451 RepID=A0A1J6IJS8_NICAT|nr:hypothetical protein A4A49_22183 [Nicotiana attenuata]